MRLDVTSTDASARLAELSEAQFTALVEAVPTGVIVAEAPGGRIVRGNASLRQILRRDVITARQSGEYARAGWYTAEGRRLEAAEFPLARAVRGESVQGAILQVERGDGSVGWTRVSAMPIRDESGLVVFGIATIDDVAGEREAQAALALVVGEKTRSLQAAQAQARALIDHSPLGMLVLLVPADGGVLIEECNPAFAQLTGLHGVAGQRLAEAFVDGAVLAAECELCLRQGGVERVLTLRYPAGERVVRSYLRPLPVVGGGERRVLLTQVDLTESRRVEAALQQAMRAEVIGQLTGGVAHEFNNLLTVVLGSLELLGRRVTDKRQQRWVQTATSAAVRGALLTRQMLAYARKQFMAPAATDVPASLAGMMELVRGSLGGWINLSTEFAPETWPALADPAQMELALLNLVVNARDAMPEGGRLVLRTANVAAGDPALPPELEPGDYVLLAVQDTGFGMSSEVLTRALEPFFTTKGIGAGSGLGLSQAYGVARQLGGTIRLRSAPLEGTSAEIFLPRAVA